MTALRKKPADLSIQISDLTKDFQVGFVKFLSVRALDRLSLHVFAGEIFGFLGRTAQARQNA